MLKPNTHCECYKKCALVYILDKQRGHKEINSYNTSNESLTNRESLGLNWGFAREQCVGLVGCTTPHTQEVQPTQKTHQLPFKIKRPVT